MVMVVHRLDLPSELQSFDISTLSARNVRKHPIRHDVDKSPTPHDSNTCSPATMPLPTPPAARILHHRTPSIRLNVPTPARAGIWQSR